MSASATVSAAEPFLELPGGFPPDTVGFAVRTTLALLLAYYVSFWIQLSSASTAGVCVAIVAQPQTGGMLSKALYRVAGTLIGGIAAVVATSAFGQDRTTLLAVFTLWLAACTFTASLLKDFRAYGAALAGYTLAIVAITDIDAPQEVFLTALDRVAAILVGVASLALVNGIFGRADAWQALVTQLRQMIAEAAEQAIRTARGEAAALSVTEEAQRATAILALRTEATYVVGELQDGRPRAAGARSAIAALLGMLSASRAVATGLAHTQPDPATRAVIDQTVAALRNPDVDSARLHPTDAAHDGVATPTQAFLVEHLDDLRAQHAFALDGLAALTAGRQPVRSVHLASYHDFTGAALNAVRTAIVTGLTALFCVYAGWGGATFTLVQISAVVALLGMQPNPTRAAIVFATQVPVPLVVAGLVEFFLLPQTGNFVSFTLAVAPFALVACALARHPLSGAGASTGMLLWYVLILAPANPPSYDLAAFLNLALQLIGSVVAVIAGFAVILPTSPPRRLTRLMLATLRAIRRTLQQQQQQQPTDRPAMLSRRYDRLATALVWLGRRTPARLAVLSRIRDLGDLDAALRLAITGLETTLQGAPALADQVAAARAALLRPAAADLQAAGAALLATANAQGTASPGVRQATAGLYGASRLLQRQQHILRLAGMAGHAAMWRP